MTRRALMCLLVVLAVFEAGALADSPKRLRLPNGLRVILKPTFATDVVAIELLFDVSAGEEPVGQQGIRYLIQRLLLRGTASESGERLARQLAEVGGVAETTTGLDYVEVYALVPADGFETALDILARSAQTPAFPEDALQSQRRAAQEASRAARDDAFQESYLALREELYRGHPYGRLTLGAPSALAALTRDDLIAFHRSRYVPNRAVLGIAGGVGQARAMAAVRSAFGDWSPGAPGPSPPVMTGKLTVSGVTVRERPVSRCHAMFGFPAPAAGDEGYYAVQVLDSILGGGATGRLPGKLRDELGLAYEVWSFYPTLAADSHFAIYVVTEQSHLEAVKATVLSALKDLQARPVSEAELSRAKSYLLGSYRMSRQRMKDQAYGLAWQEILGLGPDFEQTYFDGISRVSVSQVQEAARALFGRFVLSVVVPEG